MASSGKLRLKCGATAYTFNLSKPKVAEEAPDSSNIVEPGFGAVGLVPQASPTLVEPPPPSESSSKDYGVEPSLDGISDVVAMEAQDNGGLDAQQGELPDIQSWRNPVLLPQGEAFVLVSPILQPDVEEEFDDNSLFDGMEPPL